MTYQFWPLLASILIQPGTLFSETIRLASGEWAPYQSAALPHDGFVSRIITESFAAEGDRILYGYFPWKRSFEQAKAGEWDGTFLWFKTKAREKDFHYSDPIINVSYVLFYRKDVPFDWEAIDDLQGKRIGGTLGYSYGQSFDDALKAGKLQVERVSSDKNNFLKLLAGRIDLFPCESRTAEVILKKHFNFEQQSVITSHPKPLISDPHYLIMPRHLAGSMARIERFNKGLKTLKASGKYQKYLKMTMRQLNLEKEETPSEDVRK